MAGQPLTQRQKLILDFVVSQVTAGVPPTVREIGEACGISTPNGVMVHLDALEKKGFIRRERRKSRGIRIVNEETIAAKRERVVSAAVRYCEDLSETGYADLCHAVRSLRS